VHAWHTLSKALVSGDVAMPVTALLVAIHNMVTETVDEQYFGQNRRKFVCPADLLEGLKNNLFAEDAQVQSFTLPAYKQSAGIPGLTFTHDSISCM
jgi:hypothetical protein